MGKSDRAPVTCREIQATDFDDLILLMSEGFPERSTSYWKNLCQRLGEHQGPSQYPRYGYLLESGARPVGSVLTIFTQMSDGESPAVRCCTSCWYVKPAFRGHSLRLAREAIKFRDVLYLNPTPAPDGFRVLAHLGYEPSCKGHFLAVPSLSGLAAGVRLRRVRGEIAFPSDLTRSEREILVSHAAYGCISLIAAESGRSLPFVFSRRRSTRGYPYAQLLFCRSLASYVDFAGPLGRRLLALGLPIVAVDADGPLPAVRGKYIEGKPKFFKGAARPRLGDLAYTELALFGD